MTRRMQRYEYCSSGMRGDATDTIDVDKKYKLLVANEAMGLLHSALLGAANVDGDAFPKFPASPRFVGLRIWPISPDQ